VAESTARKSSDPRFSPSYPQRVHVRERSHWLGVLRTWEERIAAAEAAVGSRRDGGAARKLLVQMGGARDQIRDAANRMPMEVGDLYEEDHHRLEEAVRSLERLFARWETA
jgi:hypothetical protein